VIDVSSKIRTLRTATARATLRLSPATIEMIRNHQIPKGDPLEVAKVAAIQAAKNTSQIIPYCHPLPIDYVGVNYEIGENQIDATVVARAIYKTGVEMEALTGASVAALTLYDMMKMLDESMSIETVTLVSKTGGKSDFSDSRDLKLRAAVLVASDSVSAGQKQDRSGQMIVDRLKKEGIEVSNFDVVSDDQDRIRQVLTGYADDLHLDLVLTTGGTGLGPRDNTPEALQGVVEKDASGIAEALRAHGQERTPYAMFSRSAAGLRGHTIFLALPGSTKGVQDSMNTLFPALFHVFKMLRGGGHPEHEKDKLVAKP